MNGGKVGWMLYTRINHTEQIQACIPHKVICEIDSYLKWSLKPNSVSVALAEIHEKGTNLS